MTVTDRFLSYVAFDTQSDELTNMTPSTPGQMVFAEYLKEELHKMGLEDISLDENGYLMATLPANCDSPAPVVGFIAHLDTSPDMSGKHVRPRIVKDYNGEAIILNADQNIILSPQEFPELNNYLGQDLIVTDGTTLLGADDKAGIAEIITAVAYMQAHPEIKHGKIRIAFNPDEEIGKGHINSMWRDSVLILPIPWMAELSVNLNLRISMLRVRKSRLRAEMCTPVAQNIRW